MQIILAGQPQLGERLASPNLLQLRQRISIVARLEPFTPEETNVYVGHRLRLAGYDLQTPFFTPAAGAMIAERSEGIPRNINNICFNAISLGRVLKRKPIDEAVIREVIDDLDLVSVTELAVTTTRRPPRPARKISSAAVNTAVRAHRRVSLARFPALAILLLTLAWLLSAGDGSAKSKQSKMLTGAVMSRVRASSPILQVQAGPSDVPVPDTGRGSHVALRPSRYEESDPSKASNVVTQTDPARLGKRVRDLRPDAMLASLYLDWSVLPWNCPQAQVPVSAASKTALESTGNLLPTYHKRCQ